MDIRFQGIESRVPGLGFRVQYIGVRFQVIDIRFQGIRSMVSALSTLKDDDDVSDSNSLYSSEEDINKTNVRAKTLGSDGPHVSSVRYGDYRPPHGGVGSSAHAAQWNHPRDAKNVKDQFRRICKRIFCRRAMKHRSILLLILGMLALGLFVLYCGKSYILKSHCDSIKDLETWKDIYKWITANTPNSTYSMVGPALCALLGLLIVVSFLGFHYYKARKKYIQKKKTKF
ncbi:hypothetical protein, conserved in P.knowlesi [Plasmodium knowlesi strain H]|uniref:Uncharacterized protein n=2 Tax=Plasmodium knowlesi (strain H) TaxID=5851 RepID=A0A5E7WXV9_PLAKH|nr:uncharacterized protein PKNH_0607300 [Plasmodium knowlesi strain H]CAA9987123.1 hypothetical protein, conserved in P.knowlesi [Plasmodium knowlesi strain H]SBO23872.1 hypothetical protein, conserved in P.knowlesi [Plasmodium knowlesi strain H]SBO25689.1 hypothetical protein, conserved in P.knowlesi [Plasmodium knowlesi strain H]VVS76597.1 hypothetical protein, conserved in P.knowlesi [Plasmodium knowlesi strain H]